MTLAVMTLAIDIAVESPSWEGFDAEALAQEVLAVAMRQSGVTLREGAELSILLCDDAFIQNLNCKWRGKDKPTNVLSFESGEPVESAFILGDIVIAFETVQREALDEGKSFRNHVAHLLAHGFLHLIGYDHQDEDEAAEMETMERQILAEIGIADPYQDGLLKMAD
jgi:probable rRNA maturation factor